MSGYNVFSFFYDQLTFNIDYEKRVEYILRCFARLDHSIGLSLDLACGTGTITRILKKQGVDVIGLDASVDMLSIAYDKALEEGLNILYVNQEMQNLELPMKVNTCISTLDAINHVTDKKDVQKTFDRVYKYLEKDGVFIFDVNTVYKHQNVLANNTFTYDVDDVYLVWKNKLLEDNVVDITLEFNLKDGRKESENFKEKAYEIDELKNMLNKSGFEVVNIYSDLTFDSLWDDAEKATIIARK